MLMIKRRLEVLIYWCRAFRCQTHHLTYRQCQRVNGLLHDIDDPFRGNAVTTHSQAPLAVMPSFLWS